MSYYLGRTRRKGLVDVDDDDFLLGGNDFAADKGVYLSGDGRRQAHEQQNVSHKKRRLEPSDLRDTLAEWIPVPDDDFSEEGLRPLEEDGGEDGTEPESVLGKRKEYQSTTNPMSLFRPLMGFFLDEMLRHEGLGDALDEQMCAHCRRDLGGAVAVGEAARIFKCAECGEFLQCEACCLTMHARTPLHVIKEWNGNFWVDCSLAQLGLVYQLGHGGWDCPFPDSKVYSFTVIDAPVIHQIKLRYCKCAKSDDADNLEQLMRNSWYPATTTDPATCATFRTLESFRLYNTVGNMNVRDFITALERFTDTTASSGMSWLPDRYKQFGRMARQWAFLKRLRRAGRGNDAEGVEATKQGACAVDCWGCPHDGRNLPPDWRNVDPKYQFLYMLLLAVDANFRLKNRMRKNELDDPSLGPGWGYWVEPQKYKRHLKKYVHEKDISSCIAFAALLQKDTRLTTGLRVSGVGGCVCARHECMRPNGLGDLQKGERYANMDFIIMSALAGFSLMLLTISYDIGCQWPKNLPARIEKLPKGMRKTLDSVKIQYALPVWHAASHNDECQNQNSLSFKPGVGKSDGEGVERTWSVLNPAAYATKDMGRGNRADSLEGKIDNHNFLKNVGQGDTLQRKLVVAIAERDKQIRAFQEVNKTLEPEIQRAWKAMVDEWVIDGTKSNPYTLDRKDCPTEAEVRLQVRKDEETLAIGGKAPLYGKSATAFLVAGIQIEDAQRRIIAERGERALVAADRENKIEEWRHSALVKIARFRALQKIYMPGAEAVIAEAEVARDTDAQPPKAEKVKLFMPSQMPADGEDTLRGCVPGLLAMEAKLRRAQCQNALASLRSRLHAKRWLISFRNDNIVGQVQATKARTLIEVVGERVDSYARRYRRGRTALLSLLGDAMDPDLRELADEDVRLDGDNSDSDAAARKKLSMISAGRGARAPRNAPGTSKRVMSWIWTTRGALDDEEGRLHESIRVEWSRALARKDRWTEEVMLLREEMRRVLRYLGWQAGWWRERLAPRTNVSREVAAGIRAYALKQASWHDRLAGHFRVKWNVSALTAAQQLVATENAMESVGDLFGI
ncbi:hypothetical protein B0H15DRAFT_949821 [Mycena belliarum]|uniref:CxC2-like cysteine cluster KDZ transposase-associated domain-containing protein n=1 Tax=Mycena belliarum TaxID=1033014 RepID=A0AAD6U4X3_9AGAR|nr:hypothetical protein B0H15DRAFT_949821 [Mycena belliae]